MIVYLLVTHLIAPIFFGVAVSLFWRSDSGKQQAVLLGVLLAVAEFVRLVTLCMTADVWYHLTTDGYARFFFAVSFVFQVVAGFGAWHVARLA